MEASTIQEPLRGHNIELNGVIQKQILKRNNNLLKSGYHSQRSEADRVALLYEVYKEYTDDQEIRPLNIDTFSCLPVVVPTDAKYIVWKVIVTAFVYILFFSIPIDWAFGSAVWDQIPESTLIMNIALIFIILFIDIVLEFITAYYKHGNLITNRSDIIQQYLQGYFVYDVTAYLVFVIRFIAWTDRFRAIYLLFYLKWASMGKIDQLFEEIILLHRKLRTAYSFCKILAILQFTIIIFACGFYVIGEASDKAGLKSWLTEDGIFGKIQDRSIQDRLFYSFYFSLGTMTTTMGYGDIVPMNNFECGYCLIGIIFAVIIFSLMVNYLYQIISEYNVNIMLIYEKRVAINRFMKSKDLPQVLRERVRQYLNEHWAEEGTRNIELEQTILGELAPELRQEVLLNSYGILLYSVSTVFLESEVGQAYLF